MIAAIAIVSLVFPRLVAANPLPADLIGYGRISMTLERDAAGGGVAVFTCEDPAHADRLLSKLRGPTSHGTACSVCGRLSFRAVYRHSRRQAAVWSRWPRKVPRSTYFPHPLPRRPQRSVDRLGLVGPETRFMPRRAHPPARWIISIFARWA